MSAFDPVERNESLPARVTAALYRISQAMNRLLRVRGEAAGLSPAQIQALLFLQYARPGVRTIGGLAERLGATYATTSGVADALERKQLLKRQPLPEDRRTVTLQLTAKGGREAESVEDVLAEIEAAIASLPEAEQEAPASGAGDCPAAAGGGSCQSLRNVLGLPLPSPQRASRRPARSASLRVRGCAAARRGGSAGVS